MRRRTPRPPRRAPQARAGPFFSKSSANSFFAGGRLAAQRRPGPRAGRPESGARPSLERRLAASRGGGRALPPGLGRELGDALGVDLGAVRIHADAAAAAMSRELGAQAFTHRQHVYFDGGRFAPQTRAGRHLLAHELTHVVQQTGAAAPGGQVAGRSARPTLQRQQTAPTAPPAATRVTAQNKRRLVRLVDDAVRAEFGLRGPRMTRARVRLLDPARFAAAFPAGAIAEKLLELFLSPPAGSLELMGIIRHHRMGLASPRRWRRFIQDRIQIGHFTGSFFNPNSGQLETRDFTPRELLALNVGGITDVSPARRGARSVLLGERQKVETLVHEACHFYVSNAFKRMAAAIPNRGHLRAGVNIEHTLMEGYAERFARQVMRSNQATLGPLTERAYQYQVEQVARYSMTIGRRRAEDAYFRGDPGAIALLRSALQKYETTHPDLIEPWP